MTFPRRLFFISLMVAFAPFLGVLLTEVISPGYIFAHETTTAYLERRLNTTPLLFVFGLLLAIALTAGAYWAINSDGVRLYVARLFDVDRGSQATRPARDDKIDLILERLDGLSFSQANQSSRMLSADVEQEVLGFYRESLSRDLSPQIAAQIREVVNTEVTRDSENLASRFLTNSQKSIRTATATVAARGLLSLFLGIGFAVWALFTLSNAITAFTPEQIASLSVGTALFSIATRFSVALVVVLLAYFFLSLYKKSLDDLKYYQNELTDLSSQAAAFQLALVHGDADSRRVVLTELMDRHRNGAEARPAGGAPIDEKGLTEIVKAILDKLPNAGSAS